MLKAKKSKTVSPKKKQKELKRLIDTQKPKVKKQKKTKKSVK